MSVVDFVANNGHIVVLGSSNGGSSTYRDLHAMVSFVPSAENVESKKILQCAKRMHFNIRANQCVASWLLS